MEQRFLVISPPWQQSSITPSKIRKSKTLITYMRYNNDKYYSTLPKAFTIPHYKKKKSLINETLPHNQTRHTNASNIGF